MSDQEFEEAVDDALDSIPADLLQRLDNVAILIEDEVPRDASPADPGPEHHLLGLYVGTPLPERLDSYSYGALPDRIYLFREPLRRISRSRADLVRQIRVTVLHEIGHYFGLDDQQLHDLGWA